jgi:hypothetical protein
LRKACAVVATGRCQADVALTTKTGVAARLKRAIAPGALALAGAADNIRDPIDV